MTTTPPPPPPPPPPPAPPDAGPRVTREQVLDVARLRRTVGPDRRLAGVAGGLARQLDIDPVIVRVALVVLVFFAGAGLLVYAACWLLVPQDGRDRTVVALDERSRGLALVLVGVVAALALLGDSVGQWGVPWPLVGAAFVALVVLIVVERVRTDPPAGAPAYPAVPPGSRRRGPILFGYAALTALVLDAGLLVATATGSDVPGTAYPAVVLASCAAFLLLGSVWGRAGGLIPLGLLAALVLLAAVVVGPWHGAGQLLPTPRTAAEVRDDYALTAGQIDLDLTAVADPEALAGRTVHLTVRAGEIVVTVPPDLTVVADGRIRWAGEISLFDRLGGGSGGFSLTSRRDADPAMATPLVLDGDVGAGQIVVRTRGAGR